MIAYTGAPECDVRDVLIAELTKQRDDLQRELAQVKAAMKAQADVLVKQRDELLAALEKILENDGAEGSKCFNALKLYNARVDARSAISSVKGDATNIISDMVERECCGTFFRTPHRSTCPKFRGKKAAS